MRFPELQYDSPKTFTRRQRFALWLLPPLIAAAMRLLFATCRWEYRNVAHFERAVAAGPVVLAFWHECMAASIHQFKNRNYYSLTSYSYDGELAARVVRHFGSDAVRGSSSAGGSDGLANLHRALERVHGVGFTLDGPRGPRRRAKVGVSVLAARSGAQTVPCVYAFERAWRTRSWDRFPVPRPFSRVVSTLGAPIPPPAGAGPESVEAHRREVERSLNALHAELEAEVNAGNPPFPHDSSPSN